MKSLGKFHSTPHPIIFTVFSFLPFISCSNDMTGLDEQTLSEESTSSFDPNPLPIITEEGYLSFPTYSSFEAFFKQIIEDNGEVCIPQSRNGSFKSIHSLSKELLSNSRNSINKVNAISDDEELEEMSEDEFRLMKAEALIFDNILEHLMDTTMRICIDGVLYKVSEYGTFATLSENKDNLDDIIKNFDTSLIVSTDAGQTINLANDVRFTNSFREDHIDTISDTMLLADVNVQSEIQSANPYNNSFHTEFNVESYKWKNTNIIKKLFDLIRGRDVSKTNNYNKNHRIKFQVFDVNYAFYQSAGIKVSMQKRKKFLFVPYWVGETADSLAIGFNGMDAVMKLYTPNNMSMITPSADAKWSSFTSSLNGMVAKFIYGTYFQVAFFKDFTQTIYGWMPELRIGQYDYILSVTNKLYEMPPKLAYQYSRSLINKQIFDKIYKKIRPTDPMVGLLVWGNTSSTFDELHPYLTGVKTYPSLKSKSVIFNRSFGVSFIGAMPVPFIPTKFSIEYIDVFGASYYDGKWLGVRMYQIDGR